MAKSTLVIGGSRSGKSDYAQALAEADLKIRYYLATCPPPHAPQKGTKQNYRPAPAGIELSHQTIDPEMSARILAHQQRRQGGLWQTIEEPLALAIRLKTLPSEATVLIDCLTLWISNLLDADSSGTLDDAKITALGQEVLAAAQTRTGKMIIVSSEVGCGGISEHALARRYRDLVGRCNQVIAAGADQVVQVVCGIPVIIKG